MALKVGFLVATLFIGSYALPASKEDLSIYFDHTGASSRIVGGSVAESTPHMVALTIGMRVRSLLCAGSLVTPTHILTAAHCVQSAFVIQTLSPSFVGYAGNTNWYAVHNGIYFSRNITHPDYQPMPVLKNDISILVSRHVIELSKEIGLIPLNFDWVDAGVATSVSGWGRTSAGGSTSYILYTLNSQVIDGDICKRDVAEKAVQLNLSNTPDVDPSIEICTYHAPGQGTCNGDSGGALTRADTKEQIGVVSWGIPCAVGAPDMFVRVSAYRDWILESLA